MEDSVSPEVCELIKVVDILVVGAGGIGCELLKNLVLLGINNITVVDLDTIDVSNLNRQFLFRKHHVGQPKALCAAESVKALATDPDKINITPLQADITDLKKFDVDFFKKFVLVINALDNEKARRHVNRQCIAAEIPLIEGGSTGFAGQVFTIFGKETECYDCHPMPAPKGIPVCSIRATPEQPQHTIAWAKLMFELMYGPQVDVESNELNDLVGAVSKIRSDHESETPYQCAIGFVHKFFIEDIIELALAKGVTWEFKAAPEPLKPQIYNDFVTYCETIKFDNEKDFLAKIEELRSAPCTDIDTTLACFIHLVSNLETLQRSDDFKGLQFDKDDTDSMNFIALSSNLRNFNYNIPKQSIWTCQSIAGSIIPAIASTNAIVAGLQVVQLLFVLERILKTKKSGTKLKEINHRCRNCELFINRGGSRPFKMIAYNDLEAPKPNCLFCADEEASTIRIALYQYDDWTIMKFIKEILNKALGLTQPALDAYAADWNVQPEDLEEPDVVDALKRTKLCKKFGSRIEIYDPALPKMLIIKLELDEKLGGSEENQKNYPEGYEIRQNSALQQNDELSGEGAVRTDATSVNDELNKKRSYGDENTGDNSADKRLKTSEGDVITKEPKQTMQQESSDIELIENELI